MRVTGLHSFFSPQNPAVRQLLLLLFVSLGLTASVQGQNVTVNPGGGSYTTLTAAFAAINAGTHTGAVTVSIIASTNEGTGTAVLNASGSGSASYTSVTVTPSGGAWTISGGTTAGNPLIDLSGADNVTVNGLNSGGNSLTISNTTASATSGTATIRFIGGATSNTITNCTVLGSFSASVTTNGGNIYFATDAVTANGNDNNTVSNCDLGPAGASLPTKCIYSNGSTTTTALANSGLNINNNTIHDYFGAAVTSAGIYFGGGTDASTISNNKFYQAASRTQTTGGQHSAIWIANSSGNTFQITGNTVGFAASNGTGTYTFVGTTSSTLIPIFLNVGTTTATSVQGNTIAGIAQSGSMSGTSTSAPFRGIYVSGGVVNIGDVTGNTIGSQSATGSISYTSSSTSASDVMAMFNFGSSAWTVNNNNIGGITAANSSTGASNVYGIRLNTSSTVTTTVSGNTIGGTVANSLQSTSTAAGTQVAGIFISTSIATVSNNTIRNLTAAGGTGTTTAASVVGIDFISSTPVNNAAQNTIFNLSNTNTTAATIVTGIQFTGASGNIVERNLIHSLTTATNSATAEVNGIRVAGGTTTYRNNMIAIGAGITNAIGAAATNSGTTGINGFNGALGTDNFWHNSIYIGGTATAGSGASYAFNGTQTINTRSFRDNIFFNARANSGATGKHYAVKINGTVANPTGLTINNNVYFVNGTGGVFGFFNSLDVADLATWKTAVGQDAVSIFANPAYNDPTNATPDLHIHPSNPSVAEGNGFDLGVTNDYDGQTRSGLTPVDIGADAGNFVGADVIGPTISFTDLPNTLCTTGPTLVATITDASGINTMAGTKPRLYYKKSGDANTYAGNTMADNGWKYVESSSGSSPFSFTLDGTLLQSPLAGGDVIQYFVVAQDNAGTPNVGILSGTFNTPPASVNLIAGNFPLTGTIKSYNIGTAIPTTVTIGAGGTYTSITGATGSLFAAINAGGLSGNTVATIIDASVTETGAVALNQIGYGCSGPVTLTIKPQTTATLTGSVASGALIKLNGADNVIIDGSNSGGTDRSLTITNTATTAPTAVSLISLGTGAGATNNTIKNCNISTGVSAATGYGISVGGSTPGTSGADNDNVTIQNNNITIATVSIYANGTASVTSGGDDNLQIIGNTVNSNTTIQNQGIQVGNALNSAITSNTVSVTSSGAVQPVGISLETGFVSSTVTKNTITQALATNTGGYGGRGITIGTGTASSALTIANNVIYGVNGSNWSGFSNSSSAGIWIGTIGGSGTLTTTTGGVNLYFNSVSMTGSMGSASTTAITAALYVGSGASALDIRNNIFSNTQVATNATQKNYAIYSAAANTAFTNINYNDYFVSNSFNAASAIPGYIGSDRVDLAGIQAGFGQNLNSLISNPMFTSTTDLRPGLGSAVVAAGITGTGVTTDFLNVTRNTSPTLGAYENAVDAAGPTITFTPLATTCTTGDRTLTATITDPSGVPTMGAGLPVLYWKINAGSYTAATGSFVSGNTYQFTFGAAAVGGDVVSYYVVAQDNAGTPNVSVFPAAGASGFTSNPPAAATPPTTPSSYLLSSNLGGSYNVGSGGAYATLTAAVTAYNNSCLTGAVVFNLTDASYTTPAETFPININANAYASAINTLTIKPNTGVTSNISGAVNSGAVIKLNGANYVTVNGSNNGTTTRNLSITNTGTTSTNVVVIGSVGTTSVTANTLKNCVLTNGVNTSSAILVSDATAPGTDGYFTNITLQNNVVKKAYFGMYIRAFVVAGNGSGLVVKDNNLSATGTDAIRFTGIYIQGVDGGTVENDTIGNFDPATDEDDNGIFLATGAKNINVLRNRISNLTYSGTGGYGGHGIHVTSGVASANILIANNMISGISGDGWNYTSVATDNPIGISLSTTGTQSGINIYHNSINMTGNTLNQTSAMSMGIYLSAGSSADIRDNIIVNNLGLLSTTGYGSSGIYAVTANTQFTAINYNDYFVNPTGSGVKNIGQIAATGSATLAAWQGASGGDANSLNVAPNFVSATDLHLVPATNAALDNFGTPIGSVTVDIDNDLRSLTTPDMGADEFKRNVTLNLTAYIEGFMNGSVMRPVLMNSGVMGATGTQSDTLYVELRNMSAPYGVVYDTFAVLGTNGQGTFIFPAAASGNSYYIVLQHRNALETWSAAPVAMSATTTYDFSTAATQAFGSNMVLSGGKWCMYSGDINHDQSIEASDYPLWESDSNNFLSGYLKTDLNGDGVPEASDYPIWEANSNNFISVAKPL